MTSNIFQFLHEMKPAPEYTADDIEKWTLQIASVLQYLHNFDPKIIHRLLRVFSYEFAWEIVIFLGRNLFSLLFDILITSVNEWEPFDMNLPFFLPFDTKQSNELKFVLFCRDLKPGNLLLFGEGLDLKLCDFNTTRNFTETMMTRRTGTLAYMAPEILKGEFYTEKCDIYSLGIVTLTLPVPGFRLLCVARGGAHCTTLIILTPWRARGLIF